MKQELISSLGRVFLTITTDTDNRWIAVNWQGYLTASNIQEGAHAYTTALAQAGFSCVLNDTRQVRGPWDHSLDWVINEWAPNAAKAGLRYFAMVTSPETLAQGSADTFNNLLTAFETKVFASTHEAEAWLRSVSQGQTTPDKSL